ncbi:MAG: hypothetical protein ACKVQA_16560 [Burkholderiales bacterium]
MSLVTDILDRLSGVAVIKAELEQTGKRIDRLGDLLMNHETRIARIEGSLSSSRGLLEATPRQARRPRKSAA